MSRAADVIVVGRRIAGAVVARRLVDGGARVLLLEAGGRDDNPAIHDPGRAPRALAVRGRLGLRDGSAARTPRDGGLRGRAARCSEDRAA